MPIYELFKLKKGLSVVISRYITCGLWIAGCLSAVSVASGTVDPSEQPQVKVGVAEVDITPLYPVRLGGYGSRTSESRGVAQRIRAKALAIGGDDRTAVVLVTVDNRGVMGDIVDQVLKRLQQRIGIDRERFCIASTHTHSAPFLSSFSPIFFTKPLVREEQAHVDQYTHELTDHLVQVCLDAWANRSPANLAWSQGSAGFAGNRRTEGGPVDHALPTLRVTSPEGALRAVLVTYACHCTTLDPQDNLISGDWAGFAQKDLETRHPGATALVTIGCGADANPVPRTSTEAAQAHGRAIADEVERMLKQGTWNALPGSPTARFRLISLPLEPLPSRDEFVSMARSGGAVARSASYQLAKLDRGEPLQDSIPYRIQTWCFDDKLAMVFLAGEVVVDYAIRLRKELDGTRLWITAYANDRPCYIPSERVLREGGYEGGGDLLYAAIPSRLQPGLENRIARCVWELLPDQLRAPKAQRGHAAP
jgi:Neutral/alkaline non-lysosomal ceramidase, N-terminal